MCYNTVFLLPYKCRLEWKGSSTTIGLAAFTQQNIHKYSGSLNTR